MASISERCPDKGTCHHMCDDADTCFRVQCCGPFSNVFPNDVWPPDAARPEAKRDHPDHSKTVVGVDPAEPMLVVWKHDNGRLTYIHAEGDQGISDFRLERIKNEILSTATHLGEHPPEHVRVAAGAFEEGL